MHFLDAWRMQHTLVCPSSNGSAVCPQEPGSGWVLTWAEGHQSVEIPISYCPFCGERLPVPVPAPRWTR